MMKRIVLLFAAATAVLATPLLARSQGAGAQQPAPDPMAPFERLVGGQWRLEGSYQEFEWGVGRKSVRSRSYFLVEGKPKLVAEGMWYWHPGERQIRGVFTAIDMPFSLFDYATRFEGDKMIQDLRCYGTNGSETAYVETFEFTDDLHYVWQLERRTPDGLKKEMGGTYTRR